ncbi:hypothetical protein Tco_0040446 [Tanacetum coccineum]
MKKDFKDQEYKDIDKHIALENQVKILSNIVYRTSQSAQTVHMLIPKPSSYFNGKCSISFASPEYLKKAQWEKPCLYKGEYDKHDLAKLLAPESEETFCLAEESRSKVGSDELAARKLVRVAQDWLGRFGGWIHVSHGSVHGLMEVRDNDMACLASLGACDELDGTERGCQGLELSEIFVHSIKEILRKRVMM